MTIITSVCMYCDIEYGKKDGQGISGISHGICPKCLKLSDDALEAITQKKRASRTFKDFVKS